MDEELTLNTTGGRLWELVNAPIAESLAQLDGGPYEFRLGGGTTLAARWQHRDSFDIDLTVSTRANLRDLRDPDNPFQGTMRALGGNPEYLTRQWKVGFAAGEVDLIELDPTPTGGERPALVNGTPAVVLTNVQILQGKLERAEKNPVRDVFDFIKAAELDPQALAAAVNCRTRYDIEVIAITWERTNPTLERDAAEQLRGVPDPMAEDLGTLGTEAAKAIRGAVYRHVSVRTNGNQGVVETRTNSGATHRIEMAADQIDDMFTQSGLGLYLRGNTFHGDRIRNAMHDACSRGGGPQLVWETGMRPPGPAQRDVKRDRMPD